MAMRWVLLVGVVLCVLPGWGQEVVTFRFAPPVGNTLWVSNTTTTQAVDGKVESTEVVEEQTRNGVAQLEAGFALTNTLLAATKTADGKPGTISNEKWALLNMPITAECDAAGKLLAVRGFDAVVAKGKAVLTAGEHSAFGAMLTEKGLTNSFTYWWQANYSMPIGKAVKVGEKWSVTGKVPLPDGTFAAATTTTTLAGISTVDGVCCARLKYTTAIDAKAVSRALNKALAATLTDEDGKGITVSVSSCVEEGERTVDAATLLTLKDASTRTTRASLQAPKITPIAYLLRDAVDRHREAESAAEEK
ncbi:MAG: DUF6263 family protein [Armatimonadota bacterium]